jgi:putative oxidoreductase
VVRLCSLSFRNRRRGANHIEVIIAVAINADDMIRDLTLLSARLAVGGGIAAHGAQKALGWFGGPGPKGAAKIMDGFGFRPPETYATIAAWTEIATGSLVALGFGGPIGSSMLISFMIVTQGCVRLKYGFFAQPGSMEVPLLYAAVAMSLVGTDYGNASMDAMLGIRKPLRNPIFTTLAIAGGMAVAMAFLSMRDSSPGEEGKAE